MSVCMYPPTCLYVCIYIHVCKYVFMCVYIYVHVLKYLYIYVYIYIHMYSYEYICMYIHICICIYIYVHTHAVSPCLRFCVYAACVCVCGRTFAGLEVVDGDGVTGLGGLEHRAGVAHSFFLLGWRRGLFRHAQRRRQHAPHGVSCPQHHDGSLCADLGCGGRCLASA